MFEIFSGARGSIKEYEDEGGEKLRRGWVGGIGLFIAQWPQDIPTPGSQSEARD